LLDVPSHPTDDEEISMIKQEPIRASSIQFADVSDFHDVAPRNADDQACLDEVRAVLEKHGRLDRFGVCLLHKHFDLREGEILKEVCDPEARTLTIRPVSKKSVDRERVIPTAWDLRSDTEMIVCLGTGVC
jgi:hypothetical protein